MNTPPRLLLTLSLVFIHAQSLQGQETNEIVSAELVSFESLESLRIENGCQSKTRSNRLSFWEEPIYERVDCYGVILNKVTVYHPEDDIEENIGSVFLFPVAEKRRKLVQFLGDLALAGAGELPPQTGNGKAPIDNSTEVIGFRYSTKKSSIEGFDSNGGIKKMTARYATIRYRAVTQWTDGKGPQKVIISHSVGRLNP